MTDATHAIINGEAIALADIVSVSHCCRDIDTHRGSFAARDYDEVLVGLRSGRELRLLTGESEIRLVTLKPETWRDRPRMP